MYCCIDVLASHGLSESTAADFMIFDTEFFSFPQLSCIRDNVTETAAPDTSQSKSSQDLAFKQQYLHQLQQKLHEEKNTMSLVKRTSLEHTIEDLQQSLATPADKIRQLQEKAAEFQQRAANFPPDRIDYKIIAQSIAGLRRHIDKLERADLEPIMEQETRVKNGSDGLELFVDEQPRTPIL